MNAKNLTTIDQLTTFLEGTQWVAFEVANNLAKRSVVPAFVGVCVIYISLSFSIDPVMILMPFALLLGLAVRISFERLKKYF